MQTWKIGDVKITKLQEQEPIWNGTMLVGEMTPDNLKREGEWLKPFVDEAGTKIRLSIHALLVESEGRRILVDTCVGNDKPRPGFKDFNNLHTPFLADMEKAGVSELVEPARKLTGEVWLEPTPGHTPGHTSVRISSRGENAVITGDMIHHPIQVAHPEWVCEFDTDPVMASDTRKKFVERYCDQPVHVIGTHFAGPTSGHIVRRGGGFRFEA